VGLYEHGIFERKPNPTMLTDTKLRNLKPKDKLYKVNDRDGLYVAITPAGSISFRYNYSIHGRQEKCLAHEQKGVRAVYNKAEYRDQRRAMLQDWADMIDEWIIRKPRLKD